MTESELKADSAVCQTFFFFLVLKCSMDTNSHWSLSIWSQIIGNPFSDSPGSFTRSAPLKLGSFLACSRFLLLNGVPEWMCTDLLPPPVWLSDVVITFADPDPLTWIRSFFFFYACRTILPQTGKFTRALSSRLHCVCRRFVCLQCEMFGAYVLLSLYLSQCRIEERLGCVGVHCFLSF